MARWPSSASAGCLADDMGLGKTVQLIALHLRRHRCSRARRRATGPTLVVCPASLVGNWQRELAPVRARADRAPLPRRRPHLGGHRPGDVVLTTYGMVRRDRPALAESPWGLVVADEAQQIKNPQRVGREGMRPLPGRARLALTGTPVENRLTELWSLLDWTTPGLLGPVERVPPRRRHPGRARPRPRGRPTPVRPDRLAVPAAAAQGRSRASPPTCPPKTETDHPVPLTDEQAGALPRRSSRRSSTRSTEAEGIARRGLVLKLLTALKQVCNHPAHYLGQPAPLAGRSGKLDAFDDLRRGHRRRRRLDARVHPVRRDGRPADERASAELGLAAPSSCTARCRVGQAPRWSTRFQAGEFAVFVISLKAGGTGLNLTRATHVVHYDRWWNPAVENQASDRAWRIGQDRPVQVHRLISEGTLEERIADVLAAKAALAEAVVGTGEAWLTELDRRRAGRPRRARAARVECDGRRAPDVRPTWWGQAWIGALEQRARLDPNRPARGPHLRPPGLGRHDSTVGPGEIAALGAGSHGRRLPHRGAAAPLRRRRVGQVVDAIAARAAHAAALLDGELDPGIVADAADVDVDLLPGPGDLRPRLQLPRLGRAVQARRRPVLPAGRRARPRSVPPVPAAGPSPRRRPQRRPAPPQ